VKTTVPLKLPLSLLDVGGEGKHPAAWNLNISEFKTLGPDRGQLIPKWIAGNCNKIPLPDCSVRHLIMERVPLLKMAVVEIQRVIMPAGTIELRHAFYSGSHPHQLIRSLVDGEFTVGHVTIGGLRYEETIIREVRK